MSEFRTYPEPEGAPEWFRQGNEEAQARIAFEDALRVKMFALDMAVQALPNLASSIESEEYKLAAVTRAAARFERYLTGQE